MIFNPNVIEKVTALDLEVFRAHSLSDDTKTNKKTNKKTVSKSFRVRDTFLIKNVQLSNIVCCAHTSWYQNTRSSRIATATLTLSRHMDGRKRVVAESIPMRKVLMKGLVMIFPRMKVMW